MKNYYSILEINTNSNLQTIKESYRKLILKWHPDKNHKYYDTNSIFRDVKDAYDILNNNEKKIVYDIKFNDNCFSHEKDIENIIFERFKIESIIKVKKELDIVPEINLQDLNKIDFSYAYFEKNIINYNNKNLLIIYVTQLLNDIKKERNKINLLKIKNQEITIFEEYLSKNEINDLYIDVQEGINIFSKKCNCYFTNNYKYHVMNCLMNEKDVEYFFYNMKKIINSKIKKIRLAIISEIEEEISKCNKKTYNNFSSKILNWKDLIQNSNREECFLIKESLLNEINKHIEDENNKKFNKKLDGDQIKELINILNINENNIDFNILKSEIIRLKEENTIYKRKELNDKRKNLKHKIFQKKGKLNEIKQEMLKSNTITKRQKEIINKFLFIDQKNHINGLDYKNLYTKNINKLEKNIKQENINDILNIQSSIIELEKKIDHIIIEESKLGKFD